MNIKIDDLKQVFDLMIEKLNHDKAIEIELDIDFYWQIAADDWNVENEEPEIIVGSLIDDWEGLHNCINKKEILSYTEFDKCASILRAISEKQVQ